jgi:glutamate-1-semialdehyde 2,1-aminomutase
LRAPGFYADLQCSANRLVAGLRQAITQTHTQAGINAFGSLATIFFTANPVRNYADAKRADASKYAAFFRQMLDRGIFLAPSQFEAAFVSATHTTEDIDRTIVEAVASLEAISAA